MPVDQIVLGPLVFRMIAGDEGSGFAHEEYELEYSPSLARDGHGDVVSSITQCQARELAGQVGCRPSTAAEEAELSYYKESDFADVLGPGRYSIWTDTVLRKPNGENIRLSGQRKYFLRTIVENGKPVGELWVPESGVVHKWSPFGIPAETLPEGDKDKIYFSFDLEKPEIGVLFSAYGWKGKRFQIAACHEPWEWSLATSFRPVRGDVSQYERQRA